MSQILVGLGIILAVEILVMNVEGAGNRVSLPFPTNSTIIGVGAHIHRYGLEANSVIPSLLPTNANTLTKADARCPEGPGSWKAYSDRVSGAFEAPNV
jgi:hypothetical protein